MAMYRSYSLFLFLLCILVISFSLPRAQCGEEEKESGENLRREADRVVNLPGQPDASFRHYAGYVRLRREDEKALFYWFFEAEQGVAEKPLLLWLNGGPGCSSVAFGAVQELGPFLVRNNQSSLAFNRYSWNKVANLLFVEAPIGVGFSYSNKSQDLQHLGDRITAEDSYAFLLNWFQRFPEFKSHDFYIAGESYAGHYVPQLAELIYDRNNQTRKDSYINVKGFMIGNAALNDDTDQAGMIDFAWSHGVISDQLYHKLNQECNFKSDNQTILCSSALRNFFQAYIDIDIYSIYTPVCLTSLKGKKPRTSPRLVAAPRSFSQIDIWHKLPSGYDPCTTGYVEEYLNREDVQRSLHANVTKLSYPYVFCSNVIKKWNDSPATVLPIIKKLIKAGLRIWVYSGDMDGRIPMTATRYSVNEMGLKMKGEWRVWFYQKQVAGWTMEYEGLTLAILKGAGHQVPLFMPQQSLSMLSHFLSGDPLPRSRI